MATETVYIFQPFVKAKRGARIIPGQAQQMPSETTARRALERLNDKTVGGVVLSTPVDKLAGEWGEPRILAQAGEIPDAFLEAIGG